MRTCLLFAVSKPPSRIYYKLVAYC